MDDNTGNEPALEHPERLQAMDAGLVERIRSLIGDIEVDLDAPLPADDSQPP